jgi:hypothetical protein
VPAPHARMPATNTPENQFFFRLLMKSSQI